MGSGFGYRSLAWQCRSPLGLWSVSLQERDTGAVMESGYRIRGGMELLWHLCCSFLPASGIHTKLWGFYTSQTKTRMVGLL